MKILYVFDTKDHDVFKMSDLPNTIEILRKDRKPVVLKPVAIQIQDIYSRLNEAETLLELAEQSEGIYFLNGQINDYFNRYKQ